MMVIFKTGRLEVCALSCSSAQCGYPLTLEAVIILHATNYHPPVYGGTRHRGTSRIARAMTVIAKVLLIEF